MKIGSAVNFRIEMMAAHDEFANKQNNPCFIGLGSVGASEPLHFDTIGASSAAALQTYQQTGSGGNYAATLATHNVAWQKVCARYGHDMPRTNMYRIEDLLKLVEACQGHNKTRRKYLQKLGTTGFSDTTMPYHVSEPIVGTAARAIDIR